MASLNPLHWGRAFLRAPNTYPPKLIGVAFLVALSCSLVVSYVSVTLRPLQDANRLGEQSASLLALLETIGAPIPEKHLVNLESGAYVDQDPGTFRMLDEDDDPAELEQVEDVATVYEARDGGRLKLVILPVRGAGYKSTLYGYLALEGDLSTVAALMFYQHDETPGMGGRITEDAWATLWAGKHAFDESGIIRIEVVEGTGDGPYEVDGISGATYTGSGVTHLVQFWLGDEGYGPYLDRLREEEGL